MRDLGVQVRTRYVGGSQRTRFVDRAHIADIILNEGITFQSVIFYLAVIVEGEDRLLVVFEVKAHAYVHNPRVRPWLTRVLRVRLGCQHLTSMCGRDWMC